MRFACLIGGERGETNIVHKRWDGERRQVDGVTEFDVYTSLCATWFLLVCAHALLSCFGDVYLSGISDASIRSCSCSGSLRLLLLIVTSMCQCERGKVGLGSRG
jgi:hypothetical protein